MNLCSHTPTLDVTDPRGLPVRRVGFYRANAQSNLEPRITRQGFDLAGRPFASSDPRLDRPATSTVFSLSGQPLLTDNVDAGWRLTLLGEAGQALESHDSRGTLSTVEYDELMRPVARAETLDGDPARVFERFMYGDASAPRAAHNQCGRLLRRDDQAGAVWFSEYGLTGAVLHQQRGFLSQTGRVDWPQEPSQRDLLLEAQRYLSTSAVSAGGDVFEQTDARGHRRFMAYACSGEVKNTALKSLNSEATQVLVSDIHYDAMGAAEREVAGNGVISTATYDSVNGRLTRLLALTREGQVLQDLNYTYDPVGNVVSVEDAAQEISFFRNQRADPINRYVYDSLYQLIEATGREVAPTSHLPGLPDLQNLPMDPQRLINYAQRFEYDAGGNLLARHHSGAETWRMAVSSTSNRSLPQRADGTLPEEGQITEAFDGNGNLKTLQPGQVMAWDARNQLSEVIAVQREDGPDDSQLYRYDGDGQRVRKVRSSQVRTRTLTAEVRYLPGLEIHRNEATGEVRHVLMVETGRNSVRLLHWESGKPDCIKNDQLRYSLTDHLGSSTLELDQDANLTSHEGYYPFGGTAWWAGRSAVEAKYKTVRYSGKERDATGLYYYGFRYYAPWLQRWVNPDPAGDVQGVNRYGFVANNPITKVEINGWEYEGMNDLFERRTEDLGDSIIWRGLAELQKIKPDEARSIRLALARNDEVFSGAIAAAQDSGWNSFGISRQYFGYYHTQVIPGVVRDWEKTKALTSAYRTEEGYGKFVGIAVDDPDKLAYVWPDDPHGRIFLNTKKLESPDLPQTIAHEMTHLSQVSRFESLSGVQSEDNFYLDAGNAISLGRDVIGGGEAAVSEAIVNGKLTLRYFRKSGSSESTFLEQVNVLHSHRSAVKNLPSAIAVFNANPHIASVMASRNADSIVESAYSFYQVRGRQLLAQRNNGSVR